ncbi:hypothetical protein U91I_03396 [alpha proteobacterium U9-1i]|nr:hypothetical protein U91I_03396 [alpha proteobacterium U9-1i]
MDAAMTTKSPVRFDGLYSAVSMAHRVDGVTAYLRFYPDGVVLRTTSTAPADDVAKWLVKGFRAGPWNADGAYSITDKRIEFTFHLKQDKSAPLYNDKVPDGEINYRGRIEDDRLILTCRDGILKSRSDWIFSFNAVRGMK